MASSRFVMVSVHGFERRHLNTHPTPPQESAGVRTAALERPALVRLPGLCYRSPARGSVVSPHSNGEESFMARGREKDRKLRRKHRKNVQRLKSLVRARRAAVKKGKR